MEYPFTQWRLIVDPQPHSGPWNMALDEAILEAVGSGGSPAALRFYAWDPPCLSLGYAQSISDVDQDELHRRGWGIVRRPTGGRAILHTDELTYSIIGPETDPRLTGGVLESYQRLSQALILGLHRLQIPVEAVDRPPENQGNEQNPVCFEVPSNYEITIAGKKLIGSAQARRKGGVLQHGSLPLTGDLARIVQALNFPDDGDRKDAAQRLIDRAATAETALGLKITWEQAASELSAAFAEVLNLKWDLQGISPAELNRAQELVEEKYAHISWTARI